MGEHVALLNEVEGPYKRQRVGDGVSLILAKDSNTPHKYVFDDKKFNIDEAKAFAAKLGVDEVKEYNAKLSMKAAKPEVDGRIWSAGMHHVFVNDKPARVYVPEETIMQTFESVRDLIQDQGRMPIGIDHLSDSILSENEILAKMNLPDVGEVTKVGTDGQSIYILESQVTNDQIGELYETGDIPAYSIVGAMDAQPCPSGKADYVVKSIDVERVDFVQEGGCQVCKVGAQPDELILTSKKSEEEEEFMVEANEAVPQEPVEEVPEVPKDEAVQEEPVEEAPEEEAAEDGVQDKEDEAKEEEEEVVEVPAEELEEPSSELDELKKEIAELKEMLGGKKPKVEASKPESTFDPKAEVEALIKAGKALPKMRKSLLEVAETSEEAFKNMAASMPKFVNMKMESKLAKDAEDKPVPKAKPKPKTWEEEYGSLAQHFRI